LAGIVLNFRRRCDLRRTIREAVVDSVAVYRDHFVVLQLLVTVVMPA
jgi:hypothetical protein